MLLRLLPLVSASSQRCYCKAQHSARLIHIPSVRSSFTASPYIYLFRPHPISFMPSSFPPLNFAGTRAFSCAPVTHLLPPLHPGPLKRRRKRQFSELPQCSFIRCCGHFPLPLMFSRGRTRAPPHFSLSSPAFLLDLTSIRPGKARALQTGIVSSRCGVVPSRCRPSRGGNFTLTPESPLKRGPLLNPPFYMLCPFKGPVSPPPMVPHPLH